MWTISGDQSSWAGATDLHIRASLAMWIFFGIQTSETSENAECGIDWAGNVVDLDCIECNDVISVMLILDSCILWPPLANSDWFGFWSDASTQFRKVEFAIVYD